MGPVLKYEGRSSSASLSLRPDRCAVGADGTTGRIHDALRATVRNANGRDPMASAGILDAQSVKGADTVGVDSRGYDAGKKTNGRKRHLIVDITGMLIAVMVTAASMQDREGGTQVLAKVRMEMPSLAHVWTDGGYAGKLVEFARQRLPMTLDIVKKSRGQHTFEALPRRWVVERTWSWVVRCRSLGHDYERLPAHVEAMVKWAMIGLMTRRLAPSPGRRPWQPGTAE